MMTVSVCVGRYLLGNQSPQSRCEQTAASYVARLTGYLFGAIYVGLGYGAFPFLEYHARRFSGNYVLTSGQTS